MSSIVQHAEVWKPLAVREFTCTYHKVRHVGEQPNKSMTQTGHMAPTLSPKRRPYGPGMAAAAVIWFLTEYS